MRDIELRLMGHPSPDGMILAEDNAALSEAVKKLIYRLTRETVDKPGLGRAQTLAERLSTVRVGLRPGSTRMVFHVGDEEMLVDDEWGAEVDTRFWQLVDGMSNNTCPTGTSQTVAAAVDDLVRGLRHAAPTVEVTIAGRAALCLSTQDLQRDPWQAAASRPSEQREVLGELQMVDLHTAHFRIQDVAGNRIELFDVAEPQSAGRLVGQRVLASGLFTPGDHQKRSRLDGAVVVDAAERLSNLPSMPHDIDLTTLLAEAAELPPFEISAVDDEEFNDFLAAIHG